MRRVQELFYLDVREDPLLLEGLDVRGLREFCNAEKLKETEVVQKGNSKLRKGEFVVKTISLSWDGYSGWGWMRIPTGYLLELWTFLVWNK
ncbi:hypothetical protein FOTG_10685 [Fusarium oxysporum f. sp. vasinfectum 25433]|uniref:Uncharacterized protein n=1 Tax=Fusarium oxysporum f. sp. vasinfectum 25433 TaxID=1089449 RepID=X0MLL5_FUSOX|nr:hypothetical protein FOTG_10685 [Fusarium oxysporum f. sp. vasinfectum 25433]